MLLQHRGQEGCGIVSFDGKNYHSEKRHGLVGDHFTNQETLKKLPGSYAIRIIMMLNNRRDFFAKHVLPLIFIWVD